jgi:hypothetical protein
VVTQDGRQIRYDEHAGAVVRPFVITNGRTAPDIDLALVSLVRASGRTPRQLDPLLADILRHCVQPAAVVEVAARCGQPIVITKILLSDLIQQGAVYIVDALGMPTVSATEDEMLEALLRGLKKLPV